MVKKILFIFYILGTWLYGASVSASVNKQNVVKGNPIKFTIRATGGKVSFPSIRQIGGVSVTDSGTSTSTSMRISSNGMEKEMATMRSYVFVPEQDMMIPAYEVRVGNERLKTKPIKIKVTKSTAPTMKNGSTYSFAMKSSKEKVVVGESFVMTLYLSMSQRLGVQQVSEYVEPASEAFFFKSLGEQKQYRRGNTNVLEMQYSVTAKKEGNFTISPALAKLGITDRSRQDVFGRYGIKWVDVRSNALKIVVDSPKTDTDLVGTFTLSSKIDTQKVKVNRPVNLTVTIKGKGNLEDFDFSSYEIDGVTIYDDDAKVNSRIVNGTLVSSYSKSFAFISEKSFTIPKRTISIYNTKNNEVEILEVPSYEIEIEEKKGLGNILPAKAELSTVVPKDKITKSSTTDSEKQTLPYWMLGIAFVLGMLVMYVLRFIPILFKGKERPYKEAEALKILYAHISSGADVEDMVHKLYAKKQGDKSVQIDKKELKSMVDRFR